MINIQLPGDLIGSNGEVIMRGGFMPANIPAGGFATGHPQQPVQINATELLQRADFGSDVADVLAKLTNDVASLQRGITTGDTGFPVRENLEAPASILVPDDTPVRNLLPREPGAGLAVSWRQITSLGGGWGTGYDQPGGGSATRSFYAEAGAPVEAKTVYAAKTSAYKCLGVLGSVTGLAAAAGANFQDQLAVERQNQLMNLMLREELALIYGDSTSTAAPWGDGSNALAFDGLWNLVTTANGTPSAHIQTTVGELTTAHIDAQLTRIWRNGGRGMYILANSQETVSLAQLLQATGSVLRLQVSDQGSATMGFRVAKYVHPVSGEAVDVYTSRFLSAGDMFFGARYLPDGKPAAVVSVLPQVQVPFAPEKPQQIQGYVVTDLARALTAPDVHPFQVSVYETLQLRSALHFAKSSGITAYTP